ncbi:MAG: aconitate hydratase AcnA [Actinobacteria bacterium]|nr:aconitate hydratase AcnA [Actinomycetota bacterium]
MSKDSFKSKSTLTLSGKSYEIFDISGIEGAHDLPFSLKILLENLLRTEDGANITAEHIKALAEWDPSVEPDTEIQFTPARVIMQDFTGVPCIVDLATMREAIVDLGGDPSKVNPLAPAELVIDHSVIADVFGTKDSFVQNTDIEYERNRERYRFLRWGQGAFDEFKVVPPGTGIVHQVNIEFLARVIMTRKVNGVLRAYPDTVVGTDSHTTMVNGLGVLGWGVGGIEAEAALLGQPVSMLIPRVVGFKLSGQMPVGTTATDLALTITESLRKHGVVGKFVEFYGPGVVEVPMANRATIGNMSPEYGSTCAIFPIDQETLRYLELTGRTSEQVELVKEYAMKQGLWHDPSHSPRFSEHIELDLSTVVPSIAGPKRPQDRISLTNSKSAFATSLPTYFSEKTNRSPIDIKVNQKATTVKNGDVVIASITSCTNTSNPSVMIGAALLAKKAVEKGLTSAPWVKTTLAPGSKVVTDYYDRANLTQYMEKLGFNLVGYGCVTCIGNSGPLPVEISKAVNEHDLAVTAVLSGNRNFEGRISPDVKMNYLASPPLVVAYAIAGTMDHDFEKDSLGNDLKGNPVYLRDIWPSAQEIDSVISSAISSEMFTKDYASVFDGDHRWKSLDTPTGKTFEWDLQSTYVRKPPYFDEMPRNPLPLTDIANARVLAILGDSVTTDHISPAGNIKADSPAGKYLTDHGVDRKDFNSYGSRRGNHEVMIRGTFANIRLKNLLLDGVEGGFTRNFLDSGNQSTIYDASVAYQSANIPLVILAGKEYGSGSSRDWAAKGTALLGVRVVIAQSYERIHRSNLIGMGVLPLQFKEGESASSLGLTGSETFTVSGITAMNSGGVPKEVTVTADGKSFTAKVRIDTPGEADYYRHGGIMQYVLRSLL